MQDTFVDDLPIGANTLETALDCQERVISLWDHDHFLPRKWTSTTSAILQSVPEGDRSISSDVLFDVELDSGLNVLGMRWNSTPDKFSYNVQCPNVKVTKRSMLSNLACINDPLGLVALDPIAVDIAVNRLERSNVQCPDVGNVSAVLRGTSTYSTLETSTPNHHGRRS